MIQRFWAEDLFLRFRIQTSAKNYTKPGLEYKGHRDRDKAFQVHASSNLRQKSGILLFPIVPIVGFSVWNQDISQVYWQRSIGSMREIFIEATLWIF